MLQLGVAAPCGSSSLQHRYIKRHACDRGAIQQIQCPLSNLTGERHLSASPPRPTCNNRQTFFGNIVTLGNWMQLPVSSRPASLQYLRCRPTVSQAYTAQPAAHGSLCVVNEWHPPTDQQPGQIRPVQQVPAGGGICWSSRCGYAITRMQLQHACSCAGHPALVESIALSWYKQAAISGGLPCVMQWTLATRATGAGSERSRRTQRTG